MSPKVRLRQRMRVVLHMVMAFVVVILLAQLWLFTVTLDAVEAAGASSQVIIAALVCSLAGCTAVGALLRYLQRNCDEL